MTRPVVVDAVSLPGMAVADPVAIALLQEFLVAMPARVAQLRVALMHRDSPRLRNDAHRFKGAAAMYGFYDLSETAALIEQAAHEGQDDELLAQLLIELEQSVQEVCKRSQSPAS